MARIVYACRFEVPTSDGLTAVLDRYHLWITKHYRERRGLAGFAFLFHDPSTFSALPKRHSIQYGRFSSEKGDVVRIEWAYPADKDEGVLWRNEIRIGAFGDRCSVEHLISIESIAFEVSPFQFFLGSPSIIRDLCTNSIVHVGDMQLKAAPYQLDEPGIADFLELLRSPLRKLPIVFVAPFAGGEPSLIDEVAMASHLAGVAVVVVAKNAQVTWDLADELGRTLSCFNGAVRIYWPGFTDDDDPRRHPLYPGQRIDTAGPVAVTHAIERSIFAVAAFRFVPDSRIVEVIREVQDVARAKRLESEQASSGKDWELYALEIDAELTKSKELIIQLQAENENLKTNQHIFFSRSPSDDATETVESDEIEVPDSVSRAVVQARGKLKNLIFLESAFDAAENSPFRRPAEIFDALCDLDEIAATWVEQRKSKGSGGDLRMHLINRGWGKRVSMHISDTTRKRYGASYSFDYEGKSQMVEPHITLGSGDPNSCASIHFMLDENKGKIVIAHVGRHLPNTKT